MTEKHKAKKKKLYYALVDLEKAFDRVVVVVVRLSVHVHFNMGLSPRDS